MTNGLLLAILVVLALPYLEWLWVRLRRWRRPPAAPSRLQHFDTTFTLFLGTADGTVEHEITLHDIAAPPPYYKYAGKTYAQQPGGGPDAYAYIRQEVQDAPPPAALS